MPIEFVNFGMICS